jgi:hypothetical protein
VGSNATGVRSIGETTIRNQETRSVRRMKEKDLKGISDKEWK